MTLEIFRYIFDSNKTAAMGNRPIRGGLSFSPHWIIGLAVGEVRGNMQKALSDEKRKILDPKDEKSAIHVARLTIHEVGVRNYPVFSDKLVEDWRWWTR